MGNPMNVIDGSFEATAFIVSEAPAIVSSQELIERYAIRAAKGNNGGEWATHYTEQQKEFWREFVRDLVADFGQEVGDGAQKRLRTIEEHNAWRRPFHVHRQSGVGVECPLCHTEMINLYPGQVTCSNPPMLTVKCEACGHHDWIVA